MFCPACGKPNADEATFCASCGAAVGAGRTAPSAPPAAQPEWTPAPPVVAPGAWRFASWGDRVGGYIIDSLLVLGAMIVLNLVLGGMFAGMIGVFGRSSGAASGASSGLCCLWLVMFPLASILVGLYNRVYLVSTRGSSLGQGVMKLKVIDANGNLLTQGNAFIRLLVQAAFGFVPLLPLLDLLWPLWDDRCQTLHDKAVSSYVIHNPNAA